MSIKKILQEIIAAVGDFIYPPHCPLCSERVEERGFWCTDCLTAAVNPREMRLMPHQREVLSAAYAIANYRGGMRELIRRLKYNGQLNTLPYITTVLKTAQPLLKEAIKGAEVAVPVPLYAEKERQRGFNQAELIFRRWLAEQNLTWARALTRTKATPPLFNLNLQERQAALEEVFAVQNVVAVKGRHVLLTDDIMTTGTTLYESAAALRAAGAVRITALALASDAEILTRF